MSPALGLARNPFEAWPDDQLWRVCRLSDADAARLVADRVTFVVGRSGMGKTTLLLAAGAWAAARDQAASLQRAAPGVLPPAPAAGWWLLDETQVWDRAALRAAILPAAAAGLTVVAATHRPQAAWLRPELQAATRRLDGGLSTARLAALVAACYAASQVPAERFPGAPRTLVAWRRAARGNVEIALRLGYEMFEDLPRPRALTPRDVAAAARRLHQDSPELWQAARE